MAASAILGWFALPAQPPETDVVKPRRDDWRLAPAPRRPDLTSVAVLVMSAPYWGGVEVAAAPTPVEDPRWRVAAVYGAANDRSVLISFSALSKPPLRLRVGDALPSGHKIINIGERDLCIRIGNKTYRLGVERREP
jgi:hypothetical protein